MSDQDNNENENDNTIIKPINHYYHDHPPPSLRSRGISPVIGVILMVSITVILAAVIAAFVYGASVPTNEQTFTKNITVASTDWGTLLSPFYVTSTEPFTYQVGKKIYEDMDTNPLRDFTITYNQSYDHGKEVRDIKSATAIVSPPVSQPVSTSVSNTVSNTMSTLTSNDCQCTCVVRNNG